MSDTGVTDIAAEICESNKSPTSVQQVVPINLRDPIDDGVHEDAHGNLLRATVGGNSCLSACEEDQLVTRSGDQLTSALCLTLGMVNDVNTGCRSGDPQNTAQLVPDETDPYIAPGAPSSSHASVMQSDDDKFTVGQKHSFKVAVRDLEAGLYIDNMSYMDEEEKHESGICNDENNPEHVEATHEVVTAETCYHYADCSDLITVTDPDLRKMLIVQTNESTFVQDKEVLLNGENKPGGDFLEKEADVHGLRKRRGTKVDTIRSSVTGESGLVRMPEEERRGSAIASRVKVSPVDIGPDSKQKPSDKKGGKQSKGTVNPVGRRVTDSEPLENLRAKEDAETNRKVHESLDNFIRQTIRCEPYMTFSGRPGDKPLQRLRPDVLENHVAGKFGRGFKVEGGSDARDLGTEDNFGTDSHTSGVDGLKDTPISASKGIGGLARGPQHSLKVPPGVVAFTQAAAKGTDLPGWPLLSPSKMTMTKCDKCPREFCSSLNYRRHVRVHRKSLTEKKDLSKERSKVAEFWDKLTPDQACVIVNYENMEIEDLSGNLSVKALAGFIQQPGMPSMSQGLMKAGSALFDIVQNKPSVYPLPSERLLSILDDASEKTFLSGGTSVAYQRFVFNGDAAKVGLEEKNLVASMGFHVELRLVKAWMADKEAEALRNQQALFKEEEAAQQKRAKLLEKKRMKKIRQKERKVTASQSVQELENESLDDESNLPGVEEDDSPTATGSSASSLVSAHDLALPGTSDIDMNEELGHVEGRDEQVPGLAGESILERNKSRDANSMQVSEDLCPPASQGMSTTHSPEDFSGSFVPVSRKGDHSAELTGEDKGSSWLSRNVGETAQFVDGDSRTDQPLTYNRTGRPTDVQNSLHSRKGDQERITADFVRRDSDRAGVERKSLRIIRDRSRNEYSESFQKSGRDSRGYDTRSFDGASQPTFKPVRKANYFPLKNDLGISEMAGLPRSQQYRSKPSGMHRTLPSTGNGQVVWTRKVPQPAVVVSCKDRKEDSIQDGFPSESLSSDGLDVKAELLDAAELASDPAGGCEAGKSVKEESETKEVAAAPALVEFRSVIDNELHVSPDDSVCIFREKFVENGDGALFSGALLVGSLSVPIGKFATDRFVQSRDIPIFHFAVEQSLAPNATHAGHEEVKEVVSRSQPSVQAVDALCNEHVYSNTREGSDGLSGNARSDHTVPVARTNVSHDQSVKMKPSSPTTAPDRSEIGRSVTLSSGHERLAMKALPWQATAGRYVTAKVWRAVGLVGDRQDAGPGLAVSGGDGEGRSLQGEIDILPRSESDRVPSKKDGDGQSDHGNSSAVVVSNAGKYSADQASYTGGVDSARSVDSEAQVPLNGVTDCSNGPVNEDDAGTAALVSGLCSLSVFLEVAERFLIERWRVATAQASSDEYVDLAAEGVSRVTEGCNFTDMLPQQSSGQGMRHHSGADSLPCSSSSVVTQSLGKTAHDGGVFLSRIFNDSDQTGIGSMTHQTTHDDQRLDGAGSQECGVPQALSSEEVAGIRDSWSSPVDCEHFTSGNENFRSSVASAASVGRVHGSERHPESRGGGGGSLGYSHARHSQSRQEKWYRNPRDRFPEQRYLPRRRAPVEKNC